MRIKAIRIAGNEPKPDDEVVAVQNRSYMTRRDILRELFRADERYRSVKNVFNLETLEGFLL